MPIKWSYKKLESKKNDTKILTKSDAYLKRLINAIRQAFLTEEHVTSKVVSRLYRDVYRDTDQVPLQISRAARQALLESRLTTCGVCGTGTFLIFKKS